MKACNNSALSFSDISFFTPYKKSQIHILWCRNFYLSSSFSCNLATNPFGLSFSKFFTIIWFTILNRNSKYLKKKKILIITIILSNFQITVLFFKKYCPKMIKLTSIKIIKKKFLQINKNNVQFKFWKQFWIYYLLSSVYFTRWFFFLNIWLSC